MRSVKRETAFRGSAGGRKEPDMILCGSNFTWMVVRNRLQ
jgi:hypothetical protein